MSSPAAVQVKSVSKSFGVTRALSNVSLTVDRGSSVALLGRNGAGKSTLVSIITGLLSPDAGTVQFGDDEQTDQRGVGCVYQKSTLVGGLTAAENISLHHFPRSRAGLVDWPTVRRIGRERLSEWNCEHISDKLVDDLDPVERKIVEICRILSLDPHVLLLDEPTAGLDHGGTQRLFARIHEARQRGVSIVYVSHHLEEVFEVCEKATVLRDGEVVLDQSLSGLDISDIVQAMVGDISSTKKVERPPALADGAPILTVDSLTLRPRFEDVSFHVRPGECLGIAGLEGSGHVQVAEALCGLVHPNDGVVKLSGVTVKSADVRSSIAAGIGFVPEDRHNGGYVPALSVAENVTLPVMHRIVNLARVLRAKAREQVYRQVADEWAIKAWGPGQPVEELSGGNQQKVVLARAVASGPAVLVLMNPTAGVDVAAKRSIYETIKVNASKGKAVVIVSSDDEDFSLCHRVIVMFRGKVYQELHSPFSEHDLAAAIQGD
jgi:simple sugar transport system ATP-binding protein